MRSIDAIPDMTKKELSEAIAWHRLQFHFCIGRLAWFIVPCFALVLWQGGWVPGLEVEVESSTAFTTNLVCTLVVALGLKLFGFRIWANGLFLIALHHELAYRELNN